MDFRLILFFKAKRRPTEEGAFGKRDIATRLFYTSGISYTFE